MVTPTNNTYVPIQTKEKKAKKQGEGIASNLVSTQMSNQQTTSMPPVNKIKTDTGQEKAKKVDDFTKTSPLISSKPNFANKFDEKSIYLGEIQGTPFEKFQWEELRSTSRTSVSKVLDKNSKKVMNIYLPAFWQATNIDFIKHSVRVIEKAANAPSLLTQDDYPYLINFYKITFEFSEGNNILNSNEKNNFFLEKQNEWLQSITNENHPKHLIARSNLWDYISILCEFNANSSEINLSTKPSSLFDELWNAVNSNEHNLYEVLYKFFDKYPSDQVRINAFMYLFAKTYCSYYTTAFELKEQPNPNNIDFRYAYNHQLVIKIAKLMFKILSTEPLPNFLEGKKNTELLICYWYFLRQIKKNGFYESAFHHVLNLPYLKNLTIMDRLKIMFVPWSCSSLLRIVQNIYFYEDNLNSIENVYKDLKNKFNESLNSNLSKIEIIKFNTLDNSSDLAKMDLCSKILEDFDEFECTFVNKVLNSKVNYCNSKLKILKNKESTSKDDNQLFKDLITIVQSFLNLNLDGDELVASMKQKFIDYKKTNYEKMKITEGGKWVFQLVTGEIWFSLEKPEESKFKKLTISASKLFPEKNKD